MTMRHLNGMQCIQQAQAMPGLFPQIRILNLDSRVLRSWGSTRLVLKRCWRLIVDASPALPGESGTALHSLAPAVRSVRSLLLKYIVIGRAQTAQSLYKPVSCSRRDCSADLTMNTDILLEPLALEQRSLPDAVLLRILALLPAEQLAFARLVCRAAHHEFKLCKDVPASASSLPLWTLQRMCVSSTTEQQVPLLLTHRAAAGDLAGIQWLKSYPAFSSVSCNIRVCAAAAGGGHMHVLQYLRSGQQPCAWDHTACTAAAAGGHLSTLQWLRQQEPPCPWAGSDVWGAAATNGHFHILKYLKDQQCSGWDEDVCIAAAGAGRVDVLTWLRQQQPPCPHHAGVFFAAVYSGHMPVLEWYVQQEGAPPLMDEYAALSCCCAAARGGQLDVLKWLCSSEHTRRYDAEPCNVAAAAGHLHILQWLRQQDLPCPWNAEACVAAARYGHLHILQWLRQQDPPCPWNAEACVAAAGHGHLHVLQWLRAQQPPCPWDKRTCTVAANRGHLEILKWLRAQDPACP